MKIVIVTPARSGTNLGNRVTAERWARLLGGLGHSVRVVLQWPDGERDAGDDDVMLALHARRSHDSIVRFRDRHPQRPIVLALTGTDIYRDCAIDAAAQESLRIATRLIVLQPAALGELPPERREKAHVIYQSLMPPAAPPMPRQDRFDVIVIGHLREVKDSFRAAAAVRDLPESSRIHVTHIGSELEPGFEQRAKAEAAANPRWEWLGERSRDETLRRLSASRLLVLTSKMEGGANVVSEAIVCGVPVVSSRIAGSIGLLGADYPGYFPVGDTAALRELLLRAERDPYWLADLRARCLACQNLFHPDAERFALQLLLGKL